MLLEAIENIYASDQMEHQYVNLDLAEKHIKNMSFIKIYKIFKNLHNNENNTKYTKYILIN